MTLPTDITVSIATIPPRRTVLTRAVHSVLEQTLPPAALIVETDIEHAGAITTKNRALSKVTTEWVAFLDDDDEFLPDHLRLCRQHAQNTGADVVYSRPQMCGANEPALRFGMPFDADVLRQYSYIPATALVRTALAQEVGGFQYPVMTRRSVLYDDWGLWLAMLNRGARFEHLPERTWIWNLRSNSTGGRPERW